MGKVIHASGHGKAPAHFIRSLLRKQFVDATDTKTANRIIEASDLLWVKFDVEGNVSRERAVVALVDAYIGDYSEINSITGVCISSKDVLEAYIKEWKGLSKGGRPIGSHTTRRDRNSIIEWLRPYIDMAEKEDPPLYPSMNLVAGFAGYHSNTIRYYVRQYWPCWEEFLVDCKH